MSPLLKTNSGKLRLPNQIGRLIVESAALISCKPLSTQSFIQYCSDRNLKIDVNRLQRLERLGLFAPMFRLVPPDEEQGHLFIPIKDQPSAFDEGWAIDTTGIDSAYFPAGNNEEAQEHYYSRFQIYHLHTVLTSMSLDFHIDGFLDPQTVFPIDWQAEGEQWLQHGQRQLAELRTNEEIRALPLLCQYISNRYFAEAQSDQRKIHVPDGGTYTDQYMTILSHQWNWIDEVRGWKPDAAEELFGLDAKALKRIYRNVALKIELSDPLKNWHELVKHVAIAQRRRLKGNALLAEDLRACAIMLRKLYQELYGDDIPELDRVFGDARRVASRKNPSGDKRRDLEFVSNRFGVNPQPNLVLLVEGQSEEIAILRIFEKYYGVHPGGHGIELIPLKSVDHATGGKNDGYHAILLLLDYLHHHQVFTYLILDNENHVKKLRVAAKKAKSIFNEGRYVTLPDRIHIWNHSFEVDNFSLEEIAKGLTMVSEGRFKFDAKDVEAALGASESGSPLSKLYSQKANNYGLKKPLLACVLIDLMLENAASPPENRPIMKILQDVVVLAGNNPFPTSEKVYGINQASGYLGKKR